MFSLLVAITLFLTLSPALPLATLSDYRLKTVLQPARLELAAERRSSGPVKKDDASLGIATSAQAVEVVDWETGEPLFEKNSDEPLPIASITKLMTALVVLSNKSDWRKEVQMIGADERAGGIAYVAPGERVTVEQLFNLSLIASANNAAVALARSTGLSNDNFAAKMNEMAVAIGMRNSHFVEPSGLDPANVASARDVAVLLKTALLRPEIRDAIARDVYRFTTIGGRNGAVRSTDELLGSFLTRPPYRFFGGKTGYLDEAGYCLAAAASDENGNRVIAVVLGSESKEQRFREVKALLHWAFETYGWLN